MRVVVTYMSTDHESGLTYWTHGGHERVLESKKNRRLIICLLLFL
jgi:hypothetical protein